jgi:glycyl-tRNA synthetase
MSAEPASAAVSMDAIVALAKRRGFIFQSSEIYGGLNGFFDYGPLGVELKKNIRDCWWADMVRRRDDVVGVETSIIMHPKVWEASGHVAGFTDPLVDCKVSKQRFRADQLFFAAVVVDGQTVGYVSALESEKTTEDLQAAAENFKRKKAIQGKLEPVAPRDFTEAKPEEVALIPSPATGNPGDLTEARAFNMMFQTNVGAMTDASAVAYLRPETAQGMFVDFKNVVDTGAREAALRHRANRQVVPQRNHPAQLHLPLARVRADGDGVLHPPRRRLARLPRGVAPVVPRLAAQHRPARVAPLALRAQEGEARVLLAPYGRHHVPVPVRLQELWGIAARSDYDLKQHQQFSGVPQIYFDEATKQKVVPHVIEPAVGVDRILLAVLCAGYAEEDVKDDKGNVEKRTVLRLSPRIAPVKVAVLPLLKNKEALVGRARELHAKLKRNYAVFYDEGGAIGRRYRRQDEIGTPWCVTIDFDTIEKDGTFTLRERDSMQQTRITEAQLFHLLAEKVY